MSRTPETKFHPLDLKEVSDEGGFEGYASVFDTLDNGMDIISKGAFKSSLKSKKPLDVKLLWQHNPSQPIGVWEEVKEDDKGLRVQGRLLLDVQQGREAHSLMKAGALDGLSIGYRTIKATDDRSRGARILKEVDLWEISVVTFPMNAKATIQGVKRNWTIRDIEQALRDAGVPNSLAKRISSKGFDAAELEDDDLRDADIGLNDLSETLKRARDLMKGSQ